MVFLIALTGGIAAGKSTVAQILAGLGAETIDADEIARDVVLPGSAGLHQIVAEFSTEILDSEGNLDRGKLAQLVFADPHKRKKLEEILHPLIRERSRELFRAARQPIVVYSVPLLVESGVDDDFDFVITVEAGAEVQLERMTKERGMSESEARARIAAQATKEQRCLRADWVIDSAGSLESVKEQVNSLWGKLVKLARDKETGGTN